MQYQPFKKSNNATIQCLNCNKAIDIGLIAEHACGTPAPSNRSAALPYPTGVPQIRTPPSPAGSFPHAGALPSQSQRLATQRPILPKLDSSLAWQSGELTPASSGNGSSVSSPVSTTSSRTSRSRTRKSAMRPPSPELISQDCAFPPFPGMGAAKKKSSSKDRERKHPKGRRVPASATSSARSSSQSPSPLSHSRTVSSTGSSNTITRGRSRSGFGEGARPTTAPDGHAPEFSSQLRNIIVPPPSVPSFPPTLARAETTPNPPVSRGQHEAPLSRMPTFDSMLGRQHDRPPINVAEMSAFDRSADRQSGYKSRRPPPIASNLPISDSAQASKTPTPSSARSLKRTLTEKLFGRKPSRRSMVRAALSDEPETVPVPPIPPASVSSIVAPPPRPARSPEPEWSEPVQPKADSPTVTQSPIITISKSSSPERPSEPSHLPADVEQERHASFAALEGTPTTTAPGGDRGGKVYDIESNGRDLDAAFDFGLTTTPDRTREPIVEPTQLPQESSKLDVAEALRRLSVDSASSYGSIGFTDRTFSSRSSPPPSDENLRKRSEMLAKLSVEGGSMATSAQIRPREIEPTADSPTDPYCMDGQLSPNPTKIADVTAEDAIDVKAVSPSTSALHVHRRSTSSSLFSDSETDVIPKEAFRPRKDSLAGAPPPLFHPSTVPARADVRPSVLEDVLNEPSMDLPRLTHAPRQDSMSSVSSRSAIKGTCRGCSKPIMGTQKSVSSADGRLSGKYHKDCFACHTCKEPFATMEFYVHADQPYCGHHYHQLEDSLCATCGKGIEGLYMETANVAGRGKEKHHPACLKCATCRTQLTDDYFELSGKVYCERDAFRLAKHPRVHSRGPARPSPLVREYIRSGADAGAIGNIFPERRLNRPIAEAQ